MLVSVKPGRFDKRHYVLILLGILNLKANSKLLYSIREFWGLLLWVKIIVGYNGYVRISIYMIPFD